jgi:hypothetical protein
MSDPRRESSAKWLTLTREKLEKESRKMSGDEPGAAEAAAEFLDGLGTGA